MSHNDNATHPFLIQIRLCLLCHTRKAESSKVSLFQLCKGCAADLCPGSDVRRYNELLAKYGY